MAVKGAGQNRYYRKVSSDSKWYDFQPSGVYQDLFDGQSKTAKIKGGADPTYYYSSFTIPDSSNYGNSRLVGLKHYFFPTDITISDTSYLPEVKLWKADTDLEEGSEGNITVNKRDIVAFSAHTDATMPWLMETFNGAAGSVETASGTGTTIYNTGQNYLTLEDALLYQSLNLSSAVMKERHGDNLNGNDVVYVQKGSHIENRLVPDAHPAVQAIVSGFTALVAGGVAYFTGGTGYVVSAALLATINPMAESWQPVHGKAPHVVDVHFKNLPIGAIKNTSSRVYTGIGTSRKLEVTADTEASIFCDIFERGTKNIFDENDSALCWAKGNFSTNKNLTSGQSFKLETFWDKSVVPGVSGGVTIAGDYSPYNVTNRQQVCAVMELPYPHTIDTAGSKTLRAADIKNNVNVYDGEYLTDGCFPYTLPFLSTDLYIDALSPLFRANSNAHSGTGTGLSKIEDCAWLRGFAITFSRTKPLANETFYTFMVRTSSPSASTDLDPGVEVTAIDDKYDDASAYGTTVGLIIGKLPIKYSDVSPGIWAKTNKNGVRYVPDYPTVVAPFVNYWDIIDNANGGIRAGNLNYKVDGDGDCFHETLGQTIWYNKPVHSYFEDSGMMAVIEDNTWLNFKFGFVGKGDVAYEIRDSKNGELIALSALRGLGSVRPFADLDTAPRYVTFWNYNYPGKALYATNPDDYAMNDLDHKDADGALLDFDTNNRLYIDNITLENFNLIHSNASVNENNISRGKIEIPVTKSIIFGDEDAADSSTGWNINTVAPSNTYLSFGFDSLDEFDENAGSGPYNFWFNTLKQPGAGTLDEIYHTASDIAIRAGFTSNSQYELIGCQNAHSWFEYATDPVATAQPNKGLSTLGVANRGFDFDGDTQIDKFSKKGALIFDFNSQTVDYGDDILSNQVIPAKRENIFVSARALDVSSAGDGILIVDNPSIFNLEDDQDYIVFVYNRHYAESKISGNLFSATNWEDGPAKDYGVIAKVIERKGNVITFDKDLRYNHTGHLAVASGTQTKAEAALQSPLASNLYKNRIYISPLKYWLTLEVRNTSSTAGNSGAARSYSTVCMVNQDSTPPTSSDFGATFNEYKYTDAGTYLKAWNLFPSADDTVVSNQTDYGFGKEEEDNKGGGFITKVLLEEDLDTYDKWVVYDSSKSIDEDDIIPGAIFSSMLTPASSASSSSVTFATSESTDKIVDRSYGNANRMRPFSLAIYEDDVPVVSSFEVSPLQSNPYYPEFKWECKDSDTWYGFLIIDTEPPTHQYHKSSLHVPMWRPLPSTENIQMNWPPSSSDSELDVIDYFNNKRYPYGYYRDEDSDNGARTNNTSIPPSKTTVAGTHQAGSISDYTTFLSPEGLSGWCHNFSGNQDRLFLFGPEHSGSGDKEGSINGNQSSIVLHIRPDKYPGGNNTDEMGIFWSGGAGGIDLTMNNSGKIIARFYYSSSQYVELMSHSVAPITGNPTNIIVTFDKDLIHGNCKLFINGKLEDQSGKVLTAGSSTRWRTNASIKNYKSESFGYLWILAGGSGGTEYFNGKMDEFVYYPHVIYPITPADSNFTWTKPVTDIDSNGKPVSYFARLFVKDYHNIRGMTTKDIGMSSILTVHKAGVEL